MKYKIQKETGVAGSKETELQLIDGRFLCRFKETCAEVKPFVDFIFNHIPNFWDDVQEESILIKRIINDEERSLLISPDDFTAEEEAFIKKCGGEVKIERDYEDGGLEITYNGSWLEKYRGTFFVDAGSKQEMKCFDDSGRVYEVTTYYMSDITRFEKISDEDTLMKSRSMEINIASEVYDKVLALGIKADYNKRFGDITIINDNSKYRIIQYQENYYKCLTELILPHTLSDDGAILSTIIIKVFEPLFSNSKYHPDINVIIQPSLNDYIASIKKGGEVFSTLKDIEPIYTKEGKLIVNRFGDSVDFKIKDKKSNKLYALKAFTKNIQKFIDKYKAIESYFSNVTNEACLVIPKVYDNELSVNTGCGYSKIPIVISDWVSGSSLFIYVQKYKDDKVRMNMLAHQLSLVFRQIKNAEFAHGNINTRNIYIDNFTGIIRLYDYDNMFLPDYGEGILKQCDENYSFPGKVMYNAENADDFSMTTLLLSLKAISIAPSLLNLETNSTSLIFHKEDFINITKSSLTGKLPVLLEDAELRKLYSSFVIVLDKGVLTKGIEENLIVDNPYIEESQSLYNEGERLMDSEDYEESANKFKEASLMGNVKANRKLAYLVMHSLIHTDPKLTMVIAIWYFKKNLIYNDHISAFNLGVIYSWHHNYKEAAKYFNIAARLGNAIAMCNLSYAYEKGLGVEQDYSIADNYLLCASNSNNGIARDIILNAVFGLEPYYEIIDSYNDYMV